MKVATIARNEIGHLEPLSYILKGLVSDGNDVVVYINNELKIRELDKYYNKLKSLITGKQEPAADFNEYYTQKKVEKMVRYAGASYAGKIPTSYWKDIKFMYSFFINKDSHGYFLDTFNHVKPMEYDLVVIDSTEYAHLGVQWYWDIYFKSKPIIKFYPGSYNIVPQTPFPYSLFFGSKSSNEIIKAQWLGSFNVICSTKTLFNSPFEEVNENIIFLGNRELPEYKNSEPKLYPSNKTKVYVSPGTALSIQDRIFDTIFSILDDDKYYTIVGMGGNEDKYAKYAKYRSNHIVVQLFSEQKRCLSEADIFITHAGGNSIYEGAFYAIPMLLLPQKYDQFDNAISVEKNGFGLQIDDSMNYSTNLSAVINEKFNAIQKKYEFYKGSLIEHKIEILQSMTAKNVGEEIGRILSENPEKFAIKNSFVGLTQESVSVLKVWVVGTVPYILDTIVGCLMFRSGIQVTTIIKAIPLVSLTHMASTKVLEVVPDDYYQCLETSYNTAIGSLSSLDFLSIDLF